MDANTRRYPKEEIARRGDAIYERDIEPILKAKDKGKFVAIDIETGEYEIDSDEMAACDRVHARIPGAQVWLMRIGFQSAHHFGNLAPRTAQ